MKRIDVVKKRDSWAGESCGRTVPGTKARTKAEAAKRTAASSKKGHEPVRRPVPSRLATKPIAELGSREWRRLTLD